MPALKAFFAGEINTKSDVSANPMLACMTLVSQLYLSSHSLAKLASLSSTLLEIGALFARLATSSQASVVAPRTPLLAIHKTSLCKIHYYDAVIDSWL